MWKRKVVLCGTVLYMEERRREESGFFCPLDLCRGGCQACQGSCHCSHCWQPWCHQPLFVLYSPAFLSWQPATFPLLLTILLLPGLPLSTLTPLFLLAKWFSRWTLAIWRLVDWQLSGARFLPEPVLTPGTEAQGVFEAQRGQHPASPHRVRPPPGHGWQTKAAMSSKYCYEQLGATLMADLFVQVTSLEIWIQTRFAYERLYNLPMLSILAVHDSLIYLLYIRITVTFQSVSVML